MSIETPAAEPRPQPKKSHRKRKRVFSGTATLVARGEPMIWLTGGALATALFMIAGLLGLVVWQGMGTFWPVPLVQVKTLSGKVYLGEVTRWDTFRPSDYSFQEIPEAARESARQKVAAAGGEGDRRLLRTGNAKLTGTHFTWVNTFEVAEESLPKWSIVVEQMEWGRFYGTPSAFELDGKQVASTSEETWKLFQKHHAGCRERALEARSLEKYDTGYVNARQETARLAMVRATLTVGKDSLEFQSAEHEFNEIQAQCATEFQRIRDQIDKLRAENARYAVVMTTADNQTATLPVADIVRAYPANQLGWTNKLSLYVSRWWEFLSADPRESNSEGGVFPAILGTVTLTLILALAVVPFGVLAALYLKEYAKAGPIVSTVRIAVNNLAGVPSIVFGVFGLGFFCYLVGAFIDGGPRKADLPVMPPAWWFIALAILAAIGTGAFVTGVMGNVGRAAEASRARRLVRTISVLLWLAATACLVLVLATAPYFRGFFFEVSGPTYGKGGLLWASLTLALLTLPVVIVSTEEALSAVPNSMREGSYACGASKWQTIWRIVLPRALPGIMTGMILAMARGAGEVAPLMLVGAVKEASELPLDLHAPFLHPDRSFLHLGFHIFDQGFQSQNSEAAKPMVFTTTLLLIAVIFVLNIFAVWLRARLRRKFSTAQF